MSHPIDDLYRKNFQEQMNPRLDEDFDSFMLMYDAEKRRKPFGWLWFSVGGVMLATLLFGWILLPLIEANPTLSSKIIQTKSIPLNSLSSMGGNSQNDDIAVKMESTSSSEETDALGHPTTVLEGSNLTANTTSNSIKGTTVSNANVNNKAIAANSISTKNTNSSVDVSNSTRSNKGRINGNKSNSNSGKVNTETIVRVVPIASINGNNVDQSNHSLERVSAASDLSELQSAYSDQNALQTLPMIALTSLVINVSEEMPTLNSMSEPINTKQGCPINKLLSISIGTGIWAGQSSARNAASSWAQDIRVPLQIRLGHGVFAQIAPGFKHLQGKFDYSASTRQKYYDLGLQMYVYKNTPEHIYQLTMPISLGLHHQKWSFQGGVQAEALQSVYGELSRTQLDMTLNLREKVAADHVSNASDKGWLSKQDLREINFMGFAEAGYQILPALQVQLAAFYQPKSLSSFADQDHFAGDQDHWWMRFGLSYNLKP
ncbi:MAG: hypothetical protein ABIV51_01380 [Saprospiraceae bacterium]